MAITATPTNFYVQQGNRQVYLSWDLIAGATSYDVQRSLDGVNFTSVATPTDSNYLDTAVSVGTKYSYKVASVNGSGTSPYTSIQSIIPAPTSELSLAELRSRAQQRADRVNSDFVTLPEWNFFINESMKELYDLIVTTYEDYFMAPEVTFITQPNQYQYPLPDGQLTFTDSQSGSPIVAKPYYKLLGLDLGANTANNAFVSISKYNLTDRNKYLYPNSASTLYGQFNLQYRVVDNYIRFIPTPSAGQPVRILYIPRLPDLLKDTDLTTIGFSGWLQYVIVRAAKYALDKEESDTSKLDAELLFLKQRIEETASNRDAGLPDTISNVRGRGGFGGGWGSNSNDGGGWF